MQIVHEVQKIENKSKIEKAETKARPNRYTTSIQQQKMHRHQKTKLRNRWTFANIHDIQKWL